MALQRIGLDLTLDYTHTRLTGVARLELVNTSSTPAPVISLIVNRSLSVSAVRLAGAPVPFRQALTSFEDLDALVADVVEITPPVPVAPGQSVTLSVRYEGSLADYVSTGMEYIRDRIDPDFTILRADAFAFPTPRVASLRANGLASRRPFDFD